jgi:hypothetical protein
MGLLDSLTSSIKDILPSSSYLLPAALAAGTYYDYTQKQKQQKNLANAYAAYNAAASRNADSINNQLQANADKGASAIASYIKQSNAFLAPYRKAGEQFIPVNNALYGQGAKGVSDLMSQLLTPEMLHSLLNYTPPQQQQLPNTLQGLPK